MCCMSLTTTHGTTDTDLQFVIDCHIQFYNCSKSVFVSRGHSTHNTLCHSGYKAASLQPSFDTHMSLYNSPHQHSALRYLPFPLDNNNQIHEILTTIDAKYRVTNLPHLRCRIGSLLVSLASVRKKLHTSGDSKTTLCAFLS